MQKMLFGGNPKPAKNGKKQEHLILKPTSMTKTIWKISTFLFSLFAIGGHCYGQGNIPLGTWRTHASYHNAQNMIIAQEKVYVSSPNGFFHLDTDDNSTRKLSKLDGFNDIGISALGFRENSKTLIIGYENGNIDLVEKKKIFNIPTLKNASIALNKKINDLFFHQNQAYLTTGFGVLVLNLKSRLIQETWSNLGENGSRIAIYTGTVWNDSLFLATERGIISASIAPNVNLMDFNNWKRHNTSESFPPLPVNGFTQYKGTLFAAINEHGVFHYKNGKWELINHFESENYQHLDASFGTLVLTTSKNIYRFNEHHFVLKANYSPMNPSKAIIDKNGTLWIADQLQGLLSNKDGEIKPFNPSGSPYSDQFHQLVHVNGKTFALPGNLSRPFTETNDGFAFFKNGTWTNYTSQKFEALKQMPNLVDVTYHQAEQAYYFVAMNTGLVKWDKNGDFTLISDTPLSTQNNAYLSSIAIDNNAKIWITNPGSSTPLHAYQNGEWESYQLDGFGQPHDLVIMPNGDKWMRIDPIQKRGLLVFNEQTKALRQLQQSFGGGGLPDNSVNDFAMDLLGHIWGCGNNGIFYYFAPFVALSDRPIDATLPIIENGYLLRNQLVNTLAIDGGNQKWVGTNTGAWLFTEPGDDQLLHFNFDNSPLPSNRISNISINHNNGEVFFLTDKGIISYRGTATKASSTHDQVKIYPNPVKRNFSGLVGIDGLPFNANVKITDVSGKLIWETRSQGGSASWNVADYNGTRAASGIYLVFSSTEDGKETFVGKIAVVN
jgi:ligand-binding sensor domain-containing protein